MTIDGFVAGPKGEMMEWMVMDWGEDIKKYVQDLTAPVDCILMGRNLAEGFIPHWASLLENPETNDEFTQKMVNTPKIVFSKKLTTSSWENTNLAEGDFVKVIKALKKQKGGDIIAYGGADFVSSLVKKNLIDDLYLFVNPAALGKGMRIFKDLRKYKLIEAKPFNCGIALLHYSKI
jgi:dihydrofolate reductase